MLFSWHEALLPNYLHTTYFETHFSYFFVSAMPFLYALHSSLYLKPFYWLVRAIQIVPVCITCRSY